MLVLCYPKCTTCKRALKWLEDNGLKVELRNIKEDNPKEEELREWYLKSGLPLKRFFNTSGMVYRERKLKERIPNMTEDEMLAELASDGMLVKRPIVVGDDFVLVGFKEKEWEEKFI